MLNVVRFSPKLGERSAFEATVNGLRLTAADRRRYQKILDETEDDLW